MSIKHRDRGGGGARRFYNSFERTHTIPQPHHTVKAVGSLATSESRALEPTDGLVISEAMKLETFETDERIFLAQSFEPQAFLAKSLTQMRDKGCPLPFKWILSASLNLGVRSLKRLDRNDREWLDGIRDVAVGAGVYTRIANVKDNGRKDMKFSPGPVELAQVLQSQEFVNSLQRPDFTESTSEQALRALGIIDPAELNHRR